MHLSHFQQKKQSDKNTFYLGLGKVCLRGLLLGGGRVRPAHDELFWRRWGTGLRFSCKYILKCIDCCLVSELLIVRYE